MPVVPNQKPVGIRNYPPLQQNHPEWALFSPHRSKKLRLPFQRSLLCEGGVQQGRIIPIIILPNQVRPLSAALQTLLRLWIEAEANHRAHPTSSRTGSLPLINSISCTRKEENSILSRPLRRRRRKTFRENSPMHWPTMLLPSDPLLKMGHPAKQWSIGDPRFLSRSRKSQSNRLAIIGKAFLGNKHHCTNLPPENLPWCLPVP